MQIDRGVLTTQFRELPSLPSDFDVGAEVDHVASLVDTELSGFLDDYCDPRVEGAGGSGIVLSATYMPFGTRRAVKLPRKRIYVAETSDQTPPHVDPEVHALSKVSHKSITRLYDSQSLASGNGFCSITEYVEGAKPLHEYAMAICTTSECRENEYALSLALMTVAHVIYELTDAILYMHETAKLIHFDVKPDNLLVSQQGRPYVTDLGFARDITKYAQDDTLNVGFTWKYAHPSLTNPYHGGRISETPAKAKNQIPGSALLPIIDLFPFGRTIQEVLKSIESVHGETVYSFYAFNYLHVLGCLCLDGNNAVNNYSTPGRSFVSDQALRMPVQLFAKHRLATFAQVKVALERLLGLRRLEEDVPELDRWSAQTVNVSDLGITTVTPRVISLIDHPALQRLSSELQLGMLETVFPTATHTRLQHSLGVYHAVAEYVTALYYDPENPTFRVLFSGKHAERVLLAALVHDIGQTTFGHEMEELESRFSHDLVGKYVLQYDGTRDHKDRTLRQIIECTDFDCWGIDLAQVTNLLSGSVEYPMDGVLHDILDSHVDADKLDFLIRDSVECRVQYGHGVDADRFVRSLTTTGALEGDRPLLRLAIKRKGAASAESFALSRYQLYQSVYWHHTFRSVKGMLLTAAGATITDLKSSAGSLFDEDELLIAYLNYVLGLAVEPDSSSKGGVWAKIRERMAKKEEPPALSKYSDDGTTRFFWKVSADRERRLIEDLCARRYYKRIFEESLGALEVGVSYDVRNMFLRADERSKLRQQVENAMLKAVRTAIQDQSTQRESLIEDEVMRRVDEINETRYAFLVDLPTRGWAASGDYPSFVSDYKRRHFRVDVGGDQGIEKASLWTTHLADMMRQIAVFRVFCEPELHRLVTRVLSASQIQDIIYTAVPKLKPTSH